MDTEREGLSRRLVHPSRGGDEMADEWRGGGVTATKERVNHTALSFLRSTTSLSRMGGLKTTKQLTVFYSERY